jgi:hypothetical protein
MSSLNILKTGLYPSTFISHSLPYIAELLYFCGQQSKWGLGRLTLDVSRSHTGRNASTAGRTSLNERSANRWDRHLHNTHESSVANLKDRKYLAISEMLSDLPFYFLLFCEGMSWNKCIDTYLNKDRNLKTRRVLTSVLNQQLVMDFYNSECRNIE